MPEIKDVYGTTRKDYLRWEKFARQRGFRVQKVCLKKKN